MRLLRFISALSCLFLLLSVSISFGAEITSKYTTITYGADAQLRKFNKKLRINRRGAFFLGNPQEVTAAQEVGNKVDMVVEKVKTILEMFPDQLHITVRLLTSAREVQRVYQQRYRIRGKYIAFYSPKDRTIFISAKNAELPVFAHEVAHAIIHHYFKVAPSSKIHEVLAQYAEEHITD